MRIKNLPKEDLQKLDLVFKSSKNQKQASRIQVVRLAAKGFSHEKIQDITGKKEPTIQALITKYQKQGLKGILLKPHPRNHSLLTVSQKQIVKNILNTKDKPSAAGIKVKEDLDFWSTFTLKLLVKKLFNKEYKRENSYRRLFKFCNFSYQRVEFKDERRSNESGDDFKKRFEKKLKKGVLSMSW